MHFAFTTLEKGDFYSKENAELDYSILHLN